MRLAVYILCIMTGVLCIQAYAMSQGWLTDTDREVELARNVCADAPPGKADDCVRSILGMP